MKTNREELAWAAGFFDGEGSIYTSVMGRSNNSSKNIHLDIAQIHPFVLERFIRAVGIGKLYGPYAPKTKNSRQYWRYTASGYASCQAVVGLLWNWLSPVKQEQASTALASWLENRVDGRSRNKGRPRKELYSEQHA